MSETAISVRDLRKSYGSNEAVRGIDPCILVLPGILTWHEDPTLALQEVARDLR